MKKLAYLWRIFASYVFTKNNQLTFWHGPPSQNLEAVFDQVGPYYMRFYSKAQYPGPFDEKGVPMLDYHGTIGLQYNPIAIAQYALGHYNQYLATKDEVHLNAFKQQVVWMLDNLLPNEFGCQVWKHHFDFDYKQTLKNGWYSGLAQGQGLSVLVRARQVMDDERLDNAIATVFETFKLATDAGGVVMHDEAGDLWIEEYLVDPPTHILNGFMWALWGLYDLWLDTYDNEVKEIVDDCVKTIKNNLHNYDTGYWSLYELSQNRLKMLTSHFYHQLHIVQLQIMARMAGDEYFKEVADRWTAYGERKINRYRSLIGKILFKLFYY
ncbi:hypothetical protein KAR48_05660 [bacterium]|nr:hypothetical protein [bacterium]